MTGLAQAGAFPAPLWQKRKAEPLQIHSQRAFILDVTFFTEGCPEVHMADHLVTSRTGCHTSLFKTSDISALGRTAYPPNTGLGPREGTTHVGDLCEMYVYIGPRYLACPTPGIQPD